MRARSPEVVCERGDSRSLADDPDNSDRQKERLDSARKTTRR